MDSPPQQRYLLGSDVDELARLDRQAASIARPTEMLLRGTGISAGVRVLDLGTGLGHVALMLSAMVGPRGEVVALDQSPAAIEVAVERAAAAGAANVRFAEADVTTWRDDAPFDAIVARLLLFHMSDPVAVIRHHLAGLKIGGLMVAIDFDVAAARTDPFTRLAGQAAEWVIEAFRRGGAHPSIGAHLGQLVGEAGVHDVTAFGIQGYLGPDDPAAGGRLLAGVVRSLHDAIVTSGIADADEIGLDTLEDRITAEVREANAVFLPPTVACAWGRRI
jgi:SAM-dependent methyltransferase